MDTDVGMVSTQGKRGFIVGGRKGGGSTVACGEAELHAVYCYVLDTRGSIVRWANEVSTEALMPYALLCIEHVLLQTLPPRGALLDIPPTDTQRCRSPSLFWPCATV